MSTRMVGRIAGWSALAGGLLMVWGCAPSGPSPTNVDPASPPPAAERQAGEGASEAEPAASQGRADAGEEAVDPRYALDFTMNRIDGEPESLEAYKGRVVMVVNVASACGLTPQYEGLQALYTEKSDEGLVILGFPANNFGDQEPGTNKQIQEFCTGEYHVTFPMFEKISVTGEDQHPLYGRLSQEGGAPTWNFTKYLVDRQGRVVARFDPRTQPDDAALVAKVEELLAGE